MNFETRAITCCSCWFWEGEPRSSSLGVKVGPVSCNASVTRSGVCRAALQRRIAVTRSLHDTTSAVAEARDRSHRQVYRCPQRKPRGMRGGARFWTRSSSASIAPITPTPATAAHPPRRIEGASTGDRVRIAGPRPDSRSSSRFCSALIAREVFSAGGRRFRSSASDSSPRATGTRSRESSARRPAMFGTIVSSIIALVHRDAARRRRGDLPVRVRAAVAATAGRVPRRSARGDPERRLRILGHSRPLPLLREHVMPFVKDTLHLGALPFFSRARPTARACSPAGCILAIMVLPYISAVTREVLLAVPRSQREAALALGATRWEMIWDAVMPYARSGIIGGIILGLGRALGETMAVTMVIGNATRSRRRSSRPATRWRRSSPTSSARRRATCTFGADGGRRWCCSSSRSSSTRSRAGSSGRRRAGRAHERHA